MIAQAEVTQLLRLGPEEVKARMGSDVAAVVDLPEEFQEQMELPLEGDQQKQVEEEQQLQEEQQKRSPRTAA